MERRLLDEQLVAVQYREQADDAQQSALGAAVTNTGTGVSNPPTQAEVTAIRDKLNELLNSLRAAGIIAT